MSKDGENDREAKRADKLVSFSISRYLRCPGWVEKRTCAKPVGHFILTYKSPLASYTC